MHAVGDRGDRHLGLVERRPQPVEHPAADLAVQQRDAVGALREPEAHHGHVEHAAVAAGVVLGAEAQDPVGGDAGHGALRAEVLLHQLAREPVDARGHRGVRGEDRAGPGDLERGVEVERGTAVGDGQLADPLEAQEARVALVGVEHLGLGVAGEPGERPHRAYAADPEQQLLQEPVLGRAAVETVGDLAERRRVVLDVGVEQQQRHPADLGDEDARHQLRVTRDRQSHLRGGSVSLAKKRDRQAVGVEHRVGLLLPALPRELLAEVPVLVEQADTDQRDTEVARRLQVVAGQDAETAGVLRQHRGDAVLGREVGDRLRRILAGLLLEPARPGQVLLQVGVGQLEHPHEALVGGELLQPRARHRAEGLDRVAAALAPDLGIDGGEDVLRLRVPGPPQVGRQVTQQAQGLRQDGTDGESSDGSHGRTLTQKALNDPTNSGSRPDRCRQLTDE